MVQYYANGKKSHKKGAGYSSKRGRPRGTGTKKINHFSPLAAGRVVAYARRDNPNDDALLAKYLIYAFGVGRGPCLLAESFLLVGQLILLGVAWRFLRGITYILSGIVELINGSAVIENAGVITGEFLSWLRVEYGLEIPVFTKAEWLIWVGSVQSAVSAFVLFVDGLRNQVVYIRFLHKVCTQRIEARPFPIIPRELDL